MQHPLFSIKQFPNNKNRKSYFFFSWISNIFHIQINQIIEVKCKRGYSWHLNHFVTSLFLWMKNAEYWVIFKTHKNWKVQYILEKWEFRETPKQTLTNPQTTELSELIALSAWPMAILHIAEGMATQSRWIYYWAKLSD